MVVCLSLLACNKLTARPGCNPPDPRQHVRTPALDSALVENGWMDGRQDAFKVTRLDPQSELISSSPTQPKEGAKAHCLHSEHTVDFAGFQQI